MTIATVDNVLKRINSAGGSEELAVFMCDGPFFVSPQHRRISTIGKLDCVPRGTVTTESRIERGDILYVGTFNSGSVNVISALTSASEKSDIRLRGMS